MHFTDKKRTPNVQNPQNDIALVNRGENSLLSLGIAIFGSHQADFYTHHLRVESIHLVYDDGRIVGKQNISVYSLQRLFEFFAGDRSIGLELDNFSYHFLCYLISLY